MPISKMGFMPGKLIHTNEILVLLGENWFVTRSAKQAIEIIKRRLVGVDKQLHDLNKEKKVIADQFQWTQNLLQVLTSEFFKIKKQDKTNVTHGNRFA